MVTELRQLGGQMKLQNTQSSLLTNKVQSFSVDDMLVICGIDRIEGRFNKTEDIDTKDLNKYFSTQKSVGKMKWRKEYRINSLLFYTYSFFKDSPPHAFHFKLTNLKVSIVDLLMNLINVFPDILNTKVTRIDLNADIYGHLDIIKRLTYIKYKQNFTAYDKKSDNMKGLRFGKGDEEISIYSKNLSINHPVTRIEYRLSGKKIPKENNVIEALKWISTNKHFESVVFYNIGTKKQKSANLYPEQFYKKYQDLIKLDLTGVHEVRKAYQHRQNFMRKMKRRLDIEESSLKLDNYFYNQISLPLINYLNLISMYEG